MTTTMMTLSADDERFMEGLLDKEVEAKVVGTEHHFIPSRLSWETDYIIQIGCKQSMTTIIPSFPSFRLKKPYSEFRTFAKQLKKALRRCKSSSSMRKNKTFREAHHETLYLTQSLIRMIKFEPIRYLGKVNIKNARSLARRRAHRMAHILNAMLQTFRSSSSSWATIMMMAIRYESSLDVFNREVAEKIASFLSNNVIVLPSSLPEGRTSVPAPLLIFNQADEDQCDEGNCEGGRHGGAENPQPKQEGATAEEDSINGDNNSTITIPSTTAASTAPAASVVSIVAPGEMMREDRNNNDNGQEGSNSVIALLMKMRPGDAKSLDNHQWSISSASQFKVKGPSHWHNKKKVHPLVI